MNIDVQRSKYTEGLRDLLQQFYGTKDLKSSYRKKLEAKLDGFLAAAILIDLLPRKKVQKIIDEEHFNAFNMTRLERREKLALQSGSNNVDWELYDTPTIYRQ